jgi:transposase
VVATSLIGHTGDIDRFPTADRFAAYNGTAPIEWSSGNPKRPTHRLSRRGNRAMNHALHIAAVTQLRHSHSPGRAFYDRKLAEGHTPKAAIRALKRRLSNVVYRHLVTDAARRH